MTNKLGLAFEQIARLLHASDRCGKLQRPGDLARQEGTIWIERSGLRATVQRALGSMRLPPLNSNRRIVPAGVRSSVCGPDPTP